MLGWRLALSIFVAMLAVLVACDSGSVGGYASRFGGPPSTSNTTSTTPAPAPTGPSAGPTGEEPPDGGLVGATPWSPDAGTGTPPAPTGQNAAVACSGCHTTIYGQWRNAMHSNALTSPVTIAETNQVVAGPLAAGKVPNPDYTKFCINCHSPTVSSVATGATLPQADTTQGKDGISCTTCHQFNGTSELAGGGFTTGMQQGYNTGNTYFGNLDTPVENSFHTSQTGNAYSNPNVLCKNCHEVWIDRNHDGVEEKGIDLVLQETWSEYQDYKNFGGKETCVSCHMPAIPGLTRVADGAAIPGQQFAAAPDRVVHDHSFVGPDHLLDNATQSAAQAAQRAALLQSAGALQFDRLNTFQDGEGGVQVDVLIANVGAGHNFPTGFAFSRQLWVELKSINAAGDVVDGSGVLADPTDDICDGATLADDFVNPMPPFFQNCKFIDFQLTTLQQKLVSDVDFDFQDRFLVQDTPTQDVQDFFGFETWLQYLSGGVVARDRFDGNESQAALLPFEVREFDYDVRDPGPGGKITARLLYRAVPPYFLRALASKQAASEESLTPLIANEEIIQVATDEFDF